MRCFVAISLPSSPLLAKVKEECTGMGRQVESKNLHLTLKFLGELSGVDSLRRSLGEIRQSSFTVTLMGLGAFPNQRRARVLFARAGPEKNLNELAREVDEKTKEVPLDHPFTPHITILRSKGGRDFTEVIARYRDVIFLEHEVRYFSLYESILKPTGPIYNEIERYQLM